MIYMPIPTEGQPKQLPFPELKPIIKQRVKRLKPAKETIKPITPDETTTRLMEELEEAKAERARNR